MFDKQYRFKGRHALRVDQLTSAFDGESKAQLFGRNVDVYTNAPLVGFYTEEQQNRMIQKILRQIKFTTKMLWVIELFIRKKS